MKKMIHFLPEAFRIWAYRDQLNIDQVTNDYEIKVASTKEELESAYKLAHDMYVKKGLMDSDPSGLRCNIYSILPFTTILIGKFKGEIVATVSLIKDSQIGFPSDKDFLNENNILRQQGQRLVEVSSLAVHTRFRKKTSGSLISLLLMRYLFAYTKSFMNCDMILATVHPDATDFYSSFFNFQKNTRIIKYNFVKKALAQHIFTELHGLSLWMGTQFKDKPESKNLAHFFDKQFPQYVYPQRSNEFSHDIVMTTDLIKYFFMEKTKLLSELSHYELLLIKSAYENYFSLDFISELIKVKEKISPSKEIDRKFRFSAHIDAVITTKSGLRMGSIFDISVNGAYIKNLSRNQDLNIGDSIVLDFSIGSKIYSLRSVIRRKYEKQTLKYPAGYGVAFNVPFFDILQSIVNSDLAINDPLMDNTTNVISLTSKRKKVS